MNASGKKFEQNSYSEEDLLVFKTLIEEKLANAHEQVSQLEEQALGLSESLQDSGYNNGENHAYSNVEFLNTMATRQKKHIRDLEFALMRIKNKVYGICSLSGELIDKRRLLAVPTTTKSVQAKTAEQTKSQNPQRKKPETNRKPKSDKPKQFTKIIKKFNPNNPVTATRELSLDDDDDDLLSFEDGFGSVDVEAIAKDVKEEEE